MSAAAAPDEREAPLSAARAAVDAEIAAIAASLDAPDPVSRAMCHALQAGGKRLRPVLCLAAVDAVYESRGEVPPVRRAGATRPWARAAAAVELIHTYSLVHDDLPCMDDDDLRRGRPTTHVAHGTSAAIVAGFGLIPLAMRVLVQAAADLELPPARALAAARELAIGAGAAGMVGGQLLDLEGESRNLELDALRTIHGMKTGALFAASLRVGGALAGAAAEVQHALGSFGESLGLAFQIMDDVLDETMDAAVLGKTPGKDREAGKSTFVSLLGPSAARQAAVDEAGRAVAYLRQAGIGSTLLEGLAGFAVHRDR